MSSIKGYGASYWDKHLLKVSNEKVTVKKKTNLGPFNFILKWLRTRSAYKLSTVVTNITHIAQNALNEAQDAPDNMELLNSLVKISHVLPSFRKHVVQKYNEKHAGNAIDLDQLNKTIENITEYLELKRNERIIPLSSFTPAETVELETPPESGSEEEGEAPIREPLASMDEESNLLALGTLDFKIQIGALPLKTIGEYYLDKSAAKFILGKEERHVERNFLSCWKTANKELFDIPNDDLLIPIEWEKEKLNRYFPRFIPAAILREVARDNPLQIYYEDSPFYLKLAEDGQALFLNPEVELPSKKWSEVLQYPFTWHSAGQTLVIPDDDATVQVYVVEKGERVPYDFPQTLFNHIVEVVNRKQAQLEVPATAEEEQPENKEEEQNEVTEARRTAARLNHLKKLLSSVQMTCPAFVLNISLMANDDSHDSPTLAIQLQYAPGVKEVQKIKPPPSLAPLLEEIADTLRRIDNKTLPQDSPGFTLSDDGATLPSGLAEQTSIRHGDEAEQTAVIPSAAKIRKARPLQTITSGGLFDTLKNLQDDPSRTREAEADLARLQRRIASEGFPDKSALYKLKGNTLEISIPIGSRDPKKACLVVDQNQVFFYFPANKNHSFASKIKKWRKNKTFKESQQDIYLCKQLPAHRTFQEAEVAFDAQAKIMNISIKLDAPAPKGRKKGRKEKA